MNPFTLINCICLAFGILGFLHMVSTATILERNTLRTDNCVNGVLQDIGFCLCHPGFTGVFCTIEIIIGGTGDSQWELITGTLDTSKNLFDISDVNKDVPDMVPGKNEFHILGLSNEIMENMPIYHQNSYNMDYFDILSTTSYAQENNKGAETTQQLTLGSSVLTTENPMTSAFNSTKESSASTYTESSSDGSYSSTSTSEEWYLKTNNTHLGQDNTTVIFTIPTKEFSDEGICYNGVSTTLVTCSCEPGYTGEFCETDFWSYSGSGSGEITREYTKKENKQKCVNGIPLYTNSCLCHYGYTGISCDRLIDEEESSASGSGMKKNRIEENEDIDWSFTPMDYLYWKPVVNIAIPTKELVDDGYIMQDEFVAIRSGLNGTKSMLHMAEDMKYEKPGHNIYRFTLVPKQIGVKSRLELSTCFTHVNDIIEEHNIIPTEIEWMMKTSCKVSRLSSKRFHTYAYELYLPNEHFNIKGQYILTQWHGSPDPTILKDDNGCVAQVRHADLYRMCSEGLCEQGAIFNSLGHYIGLRYQQGGYPPLSFALKDGYFYISARSDEKNFMDKGGCNTKGLDPEECLDHPRQHNNVIWKMPAKYFKFDEWVKFRWDIKWSEYSMTSEKFQNGGVRTSDAWIRIWMDNKMIVDWNGPCGRNDQRSPFFKAGIYNPSGSKNPIRFFFRRYSHSHIPIYEHKDEEIRRTVQNLIISQRENEDINRNALSSKKKSKNYRFVQTSSSSKRKCVLHSEVSHVGYLKKVRFSRMLVDDYTRKVITHLIYALDDQAIKMKQLENRLDKCENIYEGSTDEEDW